MDNMGGLIKLYYLEEGDWTGFSKGSNNLYTLALAAGKSLKEIEFSQDTGKISENEEDTDDGILYRYECSCRIPKCTEDQDPFDGCRQKRLLIIGLDNNDKIWLTGFPGSFFEITSSGSTGADPQDMNARTLKIAAALPAPSVFLTALPIID